MSQESIPEEAMTPTVRIDANAGPGDSFLDDPT